MSLFDKIRKNVKVDTKVQIPNASFNGVYPTGIYKFYINSMHMYAVKSGAIFVKVDLRIGKREEKDLTNFKPLRIKPFCAVSGDAKGNKTTWTDKNGKEHYFPDVQKFNNALTALTSGKITNLFDLPTYTVKEKDKSGDIVELEKFKITPKHKESYVGFCAVVKTIVNKQENYKDINEKQESNDVLHFFTKKGLLAQELLNDVKEPKFLKDWVKSNDKDKVYNRFKPIEEKAPEMDTEIPDSFTDSDTDSGSDDVVVVDTGDFDDDIQF